ncbi:MAG: TspO protein [Gammaproteobacteria bacterium]|nr:TspO protein [Gammaproteobacteria bacterium]
MTKNHLLKVSLPILTFFAAWLGGLSTYYTDWSWYESLNKSSFNPPNYLFGIVWPILYTLMAVVSFLHAKLMYKWYIPQLLLNSGWSWLFFAQQQPEIAFIDIVALIGINLVILMKLKGQDAWLSFVMYLPYLLWITFASILNLSILVLN